MSGPTIGEEAFSGSLLTEFIILDNYTSVGVGAFSNCLSLGWVMIGSGITSLPANLFANSSIQSIGLGANVISIDPTALPSTLQNLTYSGNGTNLSGLIYSISYSTITNLVLTNPSMSVETLSEAAATSGITLPPISQLTLSGTVVTGYTGTMAGPIVIPEGITEIADNAFQLADITRVKLPSTLETIGNFAFEQCASLKYVDLGGAVTIGEAAFGSCGSLVSVVIPDTVTTIELSAFSFCTSLESVEIGNGVTVLGSDSDALEDGQWGIFYGCTNLKTVVFPSNLTAIGSFTFGFTALVNVVIPPTVTSIGISIFLGCPNLFSVTLPPSGLTTIPDGTFEGCPSLQTVKLGTGITTIGMNAFANCPSLKDLVHSDGSRQTTVPASVTTIGLGAFGACGFTHFTVPSTVTTLGEYLFYDCTLLKSATVHMTEIPPYMFVGCQALTKVIFKEPVTLIGESVFQGCTSLTTFEFPNTLQTLSWYAFNGAGLTSITLPNNLIYMNPNAFANCASLTDINFGTGLTAIVDGTFATCTSLSSVTLPSLITSILAYGFADCTSLTDISMAEVTQVGNYTFQGCTSLASIEMPNVTALGQGVFQNCTSLTDVSMSKMMPKITSVNSNTFEGCTGLVSIDMSGVTEIRSYGFADCTSLTDISMAEVTALGQSVFYNCTSLTNVSMPKTTSVNFYTFQNCTSLVSIDMPELTVVTSQAFRGCASLSDVTFSPSMTSIDPDKQFFGCTSLTRLPINYPNSGKNMETMLGVFGSPGLFTYTFTENTLYTDLSSTSNALTMTVGIDPAPSPYGETPSVATITLSTPKQGTIFGYDLEYGGTATGFSNIMAEETTTVTFPEVYVVTNRNYAAVFKGPSGEYSYTLFTA
jgi:hypothetical protein